MFGWEFPPHISGGLGTACFGLCQGLLQQGVEVLFVVPRLFGGEDGRRVRLIDASEIAAREPADVLQQYPGRFAYMEVRSPLAPYVSPENRLAAMPEKTTEAGADEGISAAQLRFAFKGHYGNDLVDEVNKYAAVAATIAREETFDVIHAHDWLTFPAGIAARAVSGKPLVVHVHATEFDRSGENIDPRVFEIERLGMEAANRVVTVSNLTRDTVIHRYGIDPAKVITVYNGILPRPSVSGERWSKSLNEKVVTFLGRITFQKGPDYFVAAARKVLDHYPDVHFVMAGSGDMMHRMIRRAAELRMSSRFHFTGFLRGDEVKHMFAMTDVFVMPSVSEPFGIAPLEALQANVPVIISRQSGVSEVLKNAIKVDFWDVNALANAIIGLLRYPRLSRSVSGNAQTELEQLTWDRASEKMKEVYEHTI